METFINDIKNIIEEFKNRKASDAQKKLIKDLTKNDKGLEGLEFLKFTEAIDLIDSLKLEIKCNEQEINLIKQKYSLNELSLLLKRTINSYEELNLRDLKKIQEDDPSYIHKNVIGRYIPKRVNIPLEWSLDYEIGISKETGKNTYVYYIKFYELLVMDFDNLSYEEVLENLKKKDSELFEIFQTYKGYHVFLVSRKISYNSNEVSEFCKDLNSDKWHLFYSRYHGYCVRISHKSGRDENLWSPVTHKYIGSFGKGLYDLELHRLLRIFKKSIHKKPEMNTKEYFPLKIEN